MYVRTYTHMHTHTHTHAHTHTHKLPLWVHIKKFIKIIISGRAVYHNWLTDCPNSQWHSHEWSKKSL